MERSAETTKLMANSANCIQREIKVKGQKLSSLDTATILKFAQVSIGAHMVLHHTIN